MSGEPTWLWDDDQRPLAAAAALTVVALVSLGAVDFRFPELALLPLPPVAFVVKARASRLPDLIPALVSFAAPLASVLIDDEIDFSLFMTVIGVGYLALVEERRRLVTAHTGVVVVVFTILGAAGAYRLGWPNWVAGCIFSWGFGTVVFRYHRVLDELNDAQAQMIDHAALVERKRIARDVHDLVGHSLSVVMLHVAGARRIVRTDPDEAEVALVQAEEAGRRSMAEIRRTVGLMRDGSDGDGNGSSPAPDLSDISGVVEQYRSAGLAIDFEVDGSIDEVDGPRAVACYRIAQEALANISKHTAGSEATLSLSVDGNDCSLAIVNRGGRLTGSNETGRGHGLVGMRERAQSVGGSLVAGPLADGWIVEVSLPRDPARS